MKFSTCLTFQTVFSIATTFKLHTWIWKVQSECRVCHPLGSQIANEQRNVKYTLRIQMLMNKTWELRVKTSYQLQFLQTSFGKPVCQQHHYKFRMLSQITIKTKIKRRNLNKYDLRLYLVPTLNPVSPGLK